MEEVEEVADTEARITATIIVLLDVMTAHEEAGDIVESAHPMMIAEEVIPHVIVQGAVLGLLNIVGSVVVLVLQDMQGTETIAPLVRPLVSTVLLAPEVEEMRMKTGTVMLNLGHLIVDMDVLSIKRIVKMDGKNA